MSGRTEIAAPGRVSKHAAIERRFNFARLAIVVHVTGRAGTVRVNVHDLATGDQEAFEGVFNDEPSLRRVALDLINHAISRTTAVIFSGSLIPSCNDNAHCLGRNEHCHGQRD